MNFVINLCKYLSFSPFKSRAFATKPCRVPSEYCPEGRLSTWTKKSAILSFKSPTAMMVKVKIPVSTTPFVKDSEYNGFIQFTRRNCGTEFLKDSAE